MIRISALALVAIAATAQAQSSGVLMVGNLEGDHLVGSSHALESIRYLLTNTTNPAVKHVLDAQVVYVFPRLNPDGGELSFTAVKSDRKGNMRPYDDDNDGRLDEDGPEDLNGDGIISVMRVKDSSGEYMIDPADARLMKKADATRGEVGSRARRAASSSMISSSSATRTRTGKRSIIRSTGRSSWVVGRSSRGASIHAS